MVWTEKTGRRESVTVAKGELLNIEWSLKVRSGRDSAEYIKLTPS